MIKNLQVCISKFQVSGLFSHLCLGVPTHKNKSIFVGDAICTGRRISNPRGNFILKFFHLSQAIQLDPCLAHVTHQCTTPAVFKKKIKSTQQSFLKTFISKDVTTFDIDDRHFHMASMG